jgi:hypothetical protein
LAPGERVNGYRTRTLEARPVLLQDCANFPPIAVFIALTTIISSVTLGQSKGGQADVTEAIPTRAPVAYGVAAAVFR